MELLCDLDFIKLEYARATASAPPSDDHFRISVHIPNLEVHAFDVSAEKGAQIAAELDVLASLIRARLLKAQFAGKGELARFE
jgi:hypothetical protein